MAGTITFAVYATAVEKISDNYLALVQMARALMQSALSAAVICAVEGGAGRTYKL
jgi:hypothetical protein